MTRRDPDPDIRAAMRRVATAIKHLDTQEYRAAVNDLRQLRHARMRRELMIGRAA